MLDLLTTPAGKAMFQMMGVFAEFERSMIQERVRAGLARAKSEGKRLGTLPIPAEKENAIREALNKPGRTEGVRKIAARFGVDPSTVQRISRPFDAAASAPVAATIHHSAPAFPRSFYGLIEWSRGLPEGLRGEQLESRFDRVRSILDYEVPAMRMLRRGWFTRQVAP